MNAPRIGGLFFGYGGLDMAVQSVIGGDLAWVSEIDPGACKVIEYRYPGVPNLGDITAIDWTHVEPVNVLCAGFPCQDVSNAGRQAGLIHGTRTGLWHEVVRAIDTLRPGLVLLENVRGLLSARGDTSVEYERADAAVDLADRLTVWVADRRDRAIREGRTADVQHLTTRAHRLVGLRRRAVAHRRRCERRIVRAVGTVLGSLADLGYDAIWYGLRAADIGAPHGRWRIFILAYPEGDAGWVFDGDSGAAADAGGEHGAERWLTGPGEAASRRTLGEPAGRDRTPLMPTPTTQDGKNTAGPSQLDRNTRPLNTEVTLLPTPSVADSMGGHISRSGDRSDELLLPGIAREMALLPTPAVNDMGEGKTVEAWDEWTAEMKAKHGNGNGHGASLAIEAQRMRVWIDAEDPDAPPGDGYWTTADRLLPTPVTEPDTGNGHARNLGQETRLLPTPVVTDVSGTRNKTAGRSPDAKPFAVGTTLGDVVYEQAWGQYAAAIYRWETITRPAPAPTEPGPKGSPRLAARFTEWMMGLPDGWITDVPGITRNEALKLAGNGVVPQQAAAALRLMLTLLTRWQAVA